jgi:hypothetical protein
MQPLLLLYPPHPGDVVDTSASVRVGMGTIFGTQLYNFAYRSGYGPSEVHYTILYYTMLYYTMVYYTILHYTILYHTTLYHTTLYCTVLYYNIYYFTLYYTILYCTLHNLSL